MTASQHGWTKGPWTQVPQTQGGDLIAHEYQTGDQMNPKGLRLIAFMMARGNSLNEDEANAHLIAAAPALYEALEACQRLINEALPKFDWAKSALDGNAIQLLNKVPIQVSGALRLARGEQPSTPFNGEGEA